MSIDPAGAGSIALFDVVALLRANPREGLMAGQVGTVVELIDSDTALVEFSGEDGKAYGVQACHRADLLRLRYVPEAA